MAVKAVDELTDDSVAITFDLPDDLAETFAFDAGQHLTILGPDEVRRSYSLCDAPVTGRLRIGVKQLPGGVFSEGVVGGLRPGDHLEVMAPSGRFTPAAPPETVTRREYVAVAAGSGITPLRAVVESVLRTQPTAFVTLIYVNRTQRHVMFLDELHDLKDTFATRLRIVHVLSREHQGADLFSGRLDGERLRAILDALVDVARIDEWFLCGPQSMVLEHRSVIQGAGATGRIHVELFHADPAPRRTPRADGGSTQGAAEVTIRLAGRHSVFNLAPGGPSVLEAAQLVRPDVPFACKGGVCGTCRARVVDGSVEMDANWALEPEELEAGYVLTCQSHPTSAAVTLDYDA